MHYINIIPSSCWTRCLKFVTSFVNFVETGGGSASSIQHSLSASLNINNHPTQTSEKTCLSSSSSSVETLAPRSDINRHSSNHAPNILTGKAFSLVLTILSNKTKHAKESCPPSHFSSQYSTLFLSCSHLKLFISVAIEP